MSAVRLCSILAVSGAVGTGCEPKLVVGEWCPEDSDDGAGGASDDGGGTAVGVPSPTSPIQVPWSTSFENGFCDYARVAGFCYGDPGADYTVVRTPVRTGKYAAAFHVRGESAERRNQARCVRQGVFPTEGYYSAWYFIPEFIANPGTWNLFHFQGGDAPGPTNLPGLWDVSVASNSRGELRLFLYTFSAEPLNPSVDAFPVIPIGEWFQIKVYFRRAADETGELAVFQNGERVFRVTDIVTDEYPWGQWYVGNFADALMPPGSTVYVDDVMISATP